MSKLLKKNPNLYYDSFCPLCIRTVYFITVFIKPKDLIYTPLSTANLSADDYSRAVSEMLLQIDEMSLWGLDSYIYLLKTSTSRASALFSIVGWILDLKPVHPLAQRVYSNISSRRKRCGPSCEV